MMGKIEKLIELKKKEGKKVDGMEKDAALNNLMDLKGAVESMIGDKAKGLKKVTVASDTEEGLEKGLEVAKEKIGEMSDEDKVKSQDESEDETEVDDSMSESDESEISSMSEDEIEAKIKELLKMKEMINKK